MTYTTVQDGDLATPAYMNARFNELLYSGIHDVFNVMDPTYGAVADSDTDDAPAIQAAISAATNAGGGIVYCPGPHRIESNIEMGSNVIIMGRSGTTTFLPPRTTSGISADVFAWRDVSHCGFVDVTIDNENLSASTNHYVSIGGYNVDYGFVRNCKVFNSLNETNHYAIFFDTDDDATHGPLWIDGNHVENIGRDGIQIKSYQNVRIANNSVKSVTNQGIDCHPYDEGSLLDDNIVIQGNIIENADEGISAIANNLSVQGNVIKDAQTYGIVCASQTTSARFSDVLIHGNILKDSVSMGIYVAEEAANVKISDNIISNPGSSGIRIDAAAEVAITDNYISDTPSATGAIFPRSGVTGSCVILDNVVRNSGTWGRDLDLVEIDTQDLRVRHTYEPVTVADGSMVQIQYVMEELPFKVGVSSTKSFAYGGEGWMAATPTSAHTISSRGSCIFKAGTVDGTEGNNAINVGMAFNGSLQFSNASSGSTHTLVVSLEAP